MLYPLIIMILMYIVIYFIKLKNYKKPKFILVTLLYFYFWLILFQTIIPTSYALNVDWKSVEPIKYPFDNLKPFNDLILKRRGAITDIVINLLMMIPFGILYSFSKKSVRVVEIINVTFLFSLFIESVQLVTSIFFVYGRNFDITDIITNTIGGVLGYVIYRLFLVKTNK